jgi:hypothetical protein
MVRIGEDKNRKCAGRAQSPTILLYWPPTKQIEFVCRSIQGDAETDSASQPDTCKVELGISLLLSSLSSPLLSSPTTKLIQQHRHEVVMESYPSPQRGKKAC